MRIIDIASLRKLFLEYLDDAKMNLSNENFHDVDAIKFGTDANDDFHDKIFLEQGFYDEAVVQVPETEEELITPGMFCYDGADMLNNPNYEAYNVMVAFEFLGFEKQRESFRRLLERYAVELRGKTLQISYKDGEFKWGDELDNTGEVYDAIISVQYPVLSETVYQSGYDRFQAYINLDLTVLRNIQLANDTDFTIDGETIAYTDLDILRKKITKAFPVRTLDTKSYAENQSISFVVSGVVNTSTTIGQKIKNAILSSSYLNTSFQLAYDGNTYTMFMSDGSLSIKPGESILFTATFESLKEGI